MSGAQGGGGIGEGIWLLIIVIVTMFVGGMTAARLASVRSGFESLVHGTLVWALSAMLAVWLIGSAASHVLGGTLNMAGNLTGSALTAAGGVAGQAVGAVASSPNTAQSDLQGAADRAKQAAAQHGMTPDSLRSLADSAAGRVKEAAGSVAGQVHGAATGAAWWLFAALVLSFFASWLGARRAMPPRAE